MTRQPNQTRNRTSEIPTFATREEEAEWWDSHDVSEFWGQMQPAEASVAPSAFSEKSMSIRLPAATLAKLRAEAQRKGVGHTTFARMLIMEQLEESEKYRAS